MNLIFEGRLLKFGRKVKHLGHVLCCSDDIFDTDVVINDLKVRTNIIMSQFSFLDMDSRIKLFNTNCSSYYGSQLMNLQSSDMNKLDIAWRVCSRRILGVSSRTHCNLLPSLMSSLSPKYEISSRIHSFFRSGVEHHSKIIAFYFLNTYVNKESIMYKNLSYISGVLGIDVYQLSFHYQLVRNLKKKLKQICQCVEEWRVNVIRDLINFRENVSESPLDLNEISFMLELLCTQ